MGQNHLISAETKPADSEPGHRLVETQVHLVCSLRSAVFCLFFGYMHTDTADVFVADIKSRASCGRSRRLATQVVLFL